MAQRDYLYGTRLVASLGLEEGTVPELERVYHSDHLGSPRWITDGDGAKVSEHTYLPFGKEITAAPDGERLKFTGHERDAADLDYMHARFYGPRLARFSSPDPLLGQAASPQSWNRYPYVGNSPMNFVDSTGLSGDPAFGLPPRSTTAQLPRIGNSAPEDAKHLIVYGKPKGIDIGKKGSKVDVTAEAGAGGVIEFSGGGISNVGVIVEINLSASFSPEGAAGGALESISESLSVAEYKDGPFDASNSEFDASLDLPGGGKEEDLSTDIGVSVKASAAVSARDVKPLPHLVNAYNYVVEQAEALIDHLKKEGGLRTPEDGF